LSPRENTKRPDKKRTTGETTISRPPRSQDKCAPAQRGRKSSRNY
jgi:hypothetical protein